MTGEATCRTKSQRVAIGLAGIFIEVHPNPEKALCDGPSATKLDEFKGFLRKVSEVDNLIKNF